MSVNLVDGVVVGLVAAALVRGARLGGAVQVLSWGGLWAGLVAGAAVAPALARVFGSPLLRVSVGLVTPLVGAALVGFAGERLGTRIWRWLRRIRLGGLDAAAGSVVAVVASLLSAWLVGFLLSAGPWPVAAREVQGSAILRKLDRALPSAPSVLGRLEQFLDRSGFPPVFAGFEPDLAAPVPLPGDPELRAALERAGASTVRITGSGCGGVLEGSGFVAGRDLVVTNAHVVAGVARPVVEDRRGRHPATPVLFDPDLDVAVLRAANLAGTPLALVPGTVPRGTTGALLGYPGGGPLRVAPAAVRRSFVAVGRDIYGGSLEARAVYEIQAKVRPGNSGGPLVEPDGRVVGVAFSRSVRQPDVGYALVAADVATRLREAAGRSGAVGTGSCTA